MLNKILNDNIKLVNSIDSTEIFITNKDYDKILISPWRNSKTSRNSIIIKSNKNEREQYYLTAMSATNGKKLTFNPYFPDEKVSQFCVKSGILFDNNNNQLPYYWSDFMTCDNLSNQDISTQMKFLDYYFSKQEILSFSSEQYVTFLIDILKQKENDDRVIEYAINLKNDYFKNIEQLKCSFSHGDLWSKDSFVNNKIIDWEWYSQCVPLGCDYLDFLFSLDEEYYYDLIEDSLNNYKKENIIEKYIPYENRKTVFKFFIFRYILRYLVQDGFKILDHSIVKRLYKLGKEI